jgi:hypothetical protein
MHYFKPRLRWAFRWICRAAASTSSYSMYRVKISASLLHSSSTLLLSSMDSSHSNTDVSRTTKGHENPLESHDHSRPSVIDPAHSSADVASTTKDNEKLLESHDHSRPSLRVPAYSSSNTEVASTSKGHEKPRGHK